MFRFDGLIQVKEGKKVIKHGLYFYYRHPSYTATVLLFYCFSVLV
ncbi:hypothetical protein CSE16_15450 [Solibacillus sp. R5-41]|nr:hypothetical protein CSE16_15450 [Solibacillus sp. R5-41]